MKTLYLFSFFLIIGISNSTHSQGLGSSDMIGLMSAPRLTIEPAYFTAGKSQMKDFIRQEMIYPKIALRNKTEGTVELSFVINVDGTTSQLKIKKSVSKEIDDEAIRIFKKMEWSPALNYGHPIVSSHNLPIKFSIRKYKKLCKARGYTTPTYAYQPVDETNTVYCKGQLESAAYPIFDKKNYGFSKFIADNIKYPEAAFKQNISGKVRISFIIETNGLASHLVVVNAVGGGCEQEAIRLLKLISWHPGLNNNMAVRSRMELDITFKLNQSSDTGYSPNNQQNSI